MDNKDKIGGRAYKNGVRLKNKKRSVKAYYNKNNKLQLEVSGVKQNRYIKYIKNIPIIRGIVILFFAIWSFLKEVIKTPKKYWFVFAIILFDLVFIFMPNSASSGLENTFFILYFAVPIILILFFKNSISEVLKFHGAEHKAVNYYENDYKGDIASYSRIHRRCGSNIVFFYIIFSILVSFFNLGLPLLLQELLILGIAYEAIKYLPKKLLGLPSLFQKIFAREPDKRQLKAAEAALEVLTNRV